MPKDQDKSTLGRRGERDPKDPDGLITVDQAAEPPDSTAYGDPRAGRDEEE